MVRVLSVYVLGKGYGETETEPHLEAPRLRQMLSVFSTIIRRPHPVFTQALNSTAKPDQVRMFLSALGLCTRLGTILVALDAS